MKRLMTAAAIVLFATPAAFAAPVTLTGKIGDSACGLSHMGMIAKAGGKMTEAQCTDACIKMGAKYVFVSAGKVYAITNQDVAGLAANAGKTVRLTGDSTGTDITVTKIAMAPKAAAKKKV